MYKNSEQQKEYYRRYYRKNKEKYAYSKKLNYWKNKCRALGESEATLENKTISQLIELCDCGIN